MDAAGGDGGVVRTGRGCATRRISMHHRSTPIALIAVTAFVAGCGGGGFEPDLSGYDAIPEIADLHLANVRTALAWDYWELREAIQPQAPTVLGSAGTSSRAELDPAVIAAIDAEMPTRGFAGRCLPGYCYKYIVAARAGQVQVVDAVEELMEFLGATDALEEAVLLLDAKSYFWDLGDATGIRQVGNGWDAIVLELVNACAPVQLDRVRVRVDAAGRLNAGAREVWSKDSNSCI
jgi:hypothetical protein